MVVAALDVVTETLGSLVVVGFLVEDVAQPVFRLDGELVTRREGVFHLFEVAFGSAEIVGGVGRFSEPIGSLRLAGRRLFAFQYLGEAGLCLVVFAVLVVVDTSNVKQLVIHRGEFGAFLAHLLETGQSLVVMLGVEQQVNGQFFGFGTAVRIRMVGHKGIQMGDCLIEGVGPRDKAQVGVVEQGILADGFVEPCRIGRIEGVAGVFGLVGVGIARSQIIRGVLADGVLVGGHLLEVGDGLFQVPRLHPADTHLIVGFSGHGATKSAFVDESIIHQRILIILLLIKSVGDKQRQFPLVLFVGIAHDIGAFVQH